MNSCVVHIDLRGDKIWVHHDGVGEGIVQDLLDAGVPKKQIVLGYHSPRERALTEFAVS